MQPITKVLKPYVGVSIITFGVAYFFLEYMRGHTKTMKKEAEGDGRVSRQFMPYVRNGEFLTKNRDQRVPISPGAVPLPGSEDYDAQIVALGGQNKR
jgi:hypothetical protein